MSGPPVLGYGRRPSGYPTSSRQTPDMVPSAPGLAGPARVGLLDRLDQLVLAHPPTATDVEALRDVHQVGLGGVRVHAAGRPAGLPCSPTRLRSLLVRGALLV